MQLTVLGQEENTAEASSCASGSCGSDNEQMSHLPDEIREKIRGIMAAPYSAMAPELNRLMDLDETALARDWHAAVAAMTGR